MKPFAMSIIHFFYVILWNEIKCLKKLFRLFRVDLKRNKKRAPQTGSSSNRQLVIDPTDWRIDTDSPFRHEDSSDLTLGRLALNYRSRRQRAGVTHDKRSRPLEASGSTRIYWSNWRLTLLSIGRWHMRTWLGQLYYRQLHMQWIISAVLQKDP